MRNTTFNLPEPLIARAKAYAADHGISVTAMIKDHLTAVTGSEPEIAQDPLVAFSNGLLSREDAISSLGLRDYSDLLVALGDTGRTPPRPPAHVVENEAVTFERIWRAS